MHPSRMEDGHTPFNGAGWMQASVKSLSSQPHEAHLRKLVLNRPARAPAASTAPSGWNAGPRCAGSRPTLAGEA